MPASLIINDLCLAVQYQPLYRAIWAILPHNMADITHRNARFRTVISLIQHDADNPLRYRESFFEGVVEGQIATEKRGTAGFGYDPVFIPNGYAKSFAELGEAIKNKISHRARAVEQLKGYLSSFLKVK